jgi:hypothetical protein
LRPYALLVNRLPVSAVSEALRVPTRGNKYWSCGMKLVELFKIIILKIDLKKTGLSTISEYESLRQELGVQINTALSGPRAGQWIGGRVKNKKIFLFFRVSDPPKAKQFILRLLNTYPILSDATIRIKGKSMKWRNYTFI